MGNWSSIKSDIILLQKSFHIYTKELKKIKILSNKLVPDGLPSHTRSISWLMEAVILQKAKYKKLKHISNVIINKSDIQVYDCSLMINMRNVYVNVKFTQEDKNNTNDFNQAFRIYDFLKKKPKSRLYYVIMKIKFKNNIVKLIDKPPTVIFAPWIQKFSVNIKNKHLQANYYGEMKKRSTKQFLILLWKHKEVKDESKKEAKKLKKRLKTNKL